MFKRLQRSFTSFAWRSTHHLGCGSPVVKVSNHGRHVMSSIPVPLKTRRVGQRCTLNLSRAETSSRWCGASFFTPFLECLKKKLTLQETLELLESLSPESSDSPTDDSSDEEAPTNNLLEFSSDSEEDYEEIEQDPGYSSLYSENTAYPTSGCIKSKVIRQWEKKRCPNRSFNFVYKIWVCGYLI
ncbi:uncharacterized protein TNCV_4307371 [Trichonephila clavipes]|nr:uncharacterized protein TNCV_4307371 [Trichonephila clavipes]